jgi:two-component system, OmpR family, response regulator
MKKVLVADDTKNIRLLLTKCLELDGYDVITASDGQQALELFEKEAFDLAFLDIKMPQLSGTEVLKKIREKGIKIPIIIITAYPTIKNAIECTHLGAVAYLQKPFSADKVRGVLLEINNLLLQRSTDFALNDMINTAKDHIENKDYEKALELLRTLISKDIDNPYLYYLISKAYSGIGNENNANKFYEMYNVLNQN